VLRDIKYTIIIPMGNFISNDCKVVSKINPKEAGLVKLDTEEIVYKKIYTNVYDNDNFPVRHQCVATLALSPGTHVVVPRHR
jgi:hypothetical protein